MALVQLTELVSSTFTDGCLRVGEAYDDPTEDDSVIFYGNISTAEACQALCVSTASCTHFSYWASLTDCWLGGTVVLSGVTATSGGAVCGPKVCSDPSPACSDPVDDCFPVCDEATAWPMGQQPQPLQCYDDDCSLYSVLDDMASGWAGKCKDLVQITPVNQTCEEACLANPRCSGYQLWEGGACWTGEGFNCETAYIWTDGNNPIEAKRFQRGTIRTFKNMSGFSIASLEQAFTEQDAVRLGDLAVEECRKMCYSVLSCRFWQFSVNTGCYFEGVSSSVPTPLALYNVTDPEVTAGEFIQRTCVEPAVEAMDVDEVNPLIFLLLLVAFCCIIAIGAYLCFACKPKPKAQKRSVKRAAPPPPPPPAQPLMQLVPVQMVQMAQPQYTYAPVATQSISMPMAQAAPMERSMFVQGGSVAIQQGSVQMAPQMAPQGYTYA